MNLFEARIILKCREWTRPKELCLRFRQADYNYGYNYVANRLPILVGLGYLERREVRSGRGKGKKVLYKATSEGLEEANRVFTAYCEKSTNNDKLKKEKSLNEYSSGAN